MDNDFKSFIEHVASSNLETFHSKAIAWTLQSLNQNAAFFCWLFEKATGKRCEKCEHLGTVAEVSNLDLVTTLKVTDEHGHEQNHLIIWENKIKADFSQKAIGQLPSNSDSQLKKKIDAYEASWLRGISQPYWYQIRWLIWKRETDKKWIDFLTAAYPQEVIEEEQKHLEEKKNYPVHWLVLSLFDPERLEILYHSQWQGHSWGNEDSSEPKGDVVLVKSLVNPEDDLNDWRFCTYREFASSLKSELPSSLEQTLLNAYVDYIDLNLSHRQQLDSGDRDSIWTLSRLLEVHEHLKDDKRITFFWSVGGSSNSSSPLLNISMRPGRELEGVCAPNGKFEGIFLGKKRDSLRDVKTSKVDFIQCSIQIQGAVKLQFAHRAYDHVKIRSVSGYIKAIHIALGNPRTDGESNSKDVRLKFLQDKLQTVGNEQFEVFRENRPSTKTGLSYSMRIKASDTDKLPCDIERPEDILALVDFVAKAFIKN